MAKRKLPRAFKLFNFLMKIMLRVGIAGGGTSLLTVRGRKSGKPYTTPVAVFNHNGQRWVHSPYGQVQWVRNLRVAGEATLTLGRHTERAYAVELSPHEAAPLLKRSFAASPSFAHAYFDVTVDAPLADFEREVLTHPVFLIKSAEPDLTQFTSFISCKNLELSSAFATVHHRGQR